MFNNTFLRLYLVQKKSFEQVLLDIWYSLSLIVFPKDEATIVYGDFTPKVKELIYRTTVYFGTFRFEDNDTRRDSSCV